jgi:hypothetical protein
MATPNETFGPLAASTGEVTSGAPGRIQPQQTSDTPPIWQPALFADGSVDSAKPAGSAGERAGSTEEARAGVEDWHAPTGDEQASLEAARALAVPAATRRPIRARTSSATVLLAISALVALGGIGFAVGRATSTGQTGTGTSNGAANGNPGFGQLGPNASGFPGDFGGRSLGASTMTGTVVSVSAGSITLRLADGQTVQVATGSSTTYHGQTSATGSDVAAGDTVIVQTTTSTAAGSSPGTNAGASADPAANAATRTATDVTITAK